MLGTSRTVTLAMDLMPPMMTSAVSTANSKPMDQALFASQALSAKSTTMAAA